MASPKEWEPGRFPKPVGPIPIPPPLPEPRFVPDGFFVANELPSLVKPG